MRVRRTTPALTAAIALLACGEDRAERVIPSAGRMILAIRPDGAQTWLALDLE